MALKFNISQAVPFKFYHQADEFAVNASTTDFAVFPSNFNQRHMDEDFMERNLKNWEDKRCYLQPVQQSDVIVLQWLGQAFAFGGTINPYYVRILDKNGKVVKSQQPTTPGLLGTDTIYNIKMGIWDVLEGIYFIQLKFQGYFSDPDAYMISEPIEIKAFHENTMLFEGSNTFNDQGIIWAYNSLQMQLRVHASLIEFSPENKSYVYNNEPMDAVLVSAIPYREFKLEFGRKGSCIPDWMADKINRFLSFNTITIDGKGFARKQGATLEPKRIEGHPLSKWSVPLSESSSAHDILISTTQRINLGAIPTTDYFYIKGLYANSLTAYFSPAFETYFKGQKNFLDYLNGFYKLSYFPGLVGQFTIDVNNDLIYSTPSDSEYTTLLAVDLEIAGVLSYGLKLKLSGANTLAIGIDGSGHYALVHGDGSQVNYTSYSGATALTKTYTPKVDRDAYLFLDTCTLINESLGSSKIISIGGNLPGDIETFNIKNNSLRFVENNLFLSCIGGISTIDLTDNNLNTNEVNKLIMYLYEALTAGSLPTSGSNTADFSAQANSAPPSKSSGFLNFLSQLSNNNWTVTTD